MSEACSFFKQHGFEVGAWFWGLQFDTPLDFVVIKTLQGKCVKNFACPADERFLGVFEDILHEFDELGSLISAVEIMSDVKLYNHYLKKYMVIMLNL